MSEPTTTTSKARLPLPSLNQLAARMSQSGDLPTTNVATTNRPRLAQFGALRTNSSNASSMDSLAVQPSTTRDATPEREVVDEKVVADDKDQTDKEIPAEQPLNNTLNVPSTLKKAPAGYKNIPSLSDIAARLHRISIDGTHRPPEPELIEDPKTPGLKIKPAEHPLQYSWTIYHDTKAKLPFTPTVGPGGALNSPVAETPIEASSTEYEANLTTIGSFKTVEEFCRYFNWLKPPSKLERNSNYHLFKSGIKPMWEDPANANGGKWVLTFKSNPVLLDQCWNYLAMALIGQEIEGTETDEAGEGIICGVVVSLRSKVDRIQVWIRKKDDVEQVNAIGKKIVSLLDISEGDGVGLEFQYNTDDRPLPNKFLSIQSLPPNSSFRASFHARTSSTDAASPIGQAGPGGPGGAFGAFGVGIGGQWRLKK